MPIDPGSPWNGIIRPDLPPLGPPVRRPEFEHLVPRQLRANLLWRKKIIERCRNDLAFRHQQWMMCARDPIYWINTFLFLYEPRESAYIPWITYPYQDYAISWIMERITKEDMLIFKSRDMGASYMLIAAARHLLQFKPKSRGLFMSYKEELVDATENPASMFWKFDHMASSQPHWFSPQINRMNCHADNEQNGATVHGQSTTAKSTSADRAGYVLLDESSKMDRLRDIWTGAEAVTKSRILNFTAWANPIAEELTKKEDIQKIRLHWAYHPVKGKDLYWTDEPPRGLNNFKQGFARSPEYDRAHRRALHKNEVYREWDAEFIGEASGFIERELLDRLRGEAVPPLSTGQMDFDSERNVIIGFSPERDGPMELWAPLDPTGKPRQDHDYVMGVDISAGTGYSDSAMSVIDATTREKVASYAISTIDPQEWAKRAIAIGRWFTGPSGPAMMIWEAQGPGEQFTPVILAAGYPRYYRRPKDLRSEKVEISDKPGFWVSTPSKNTLLGQYKFGLRSGNIMMRDAKEVDELAKFKYFPDGSIAHEGERECQDASGLGDNHGDRGVATALAFKLLAPDTTLNLDTEKATPWDCPKALMDRYLRDQDRKKNGVAWTSWRRTG